MGRLTERNGLKQSGWEIVGNRSPNKIQNYLCRRESHANKLSCTLKTKCQKLNSNFYQKSFLAFETIHIPLIHMFEFSFTEEILTEDKIIHLDS